MTCRPTGVLKIDLGALRENYRLLAGMAAPAACAAVVKADGYGLGATRIARALYRSGCRLFFTATLEEAVALRRRTPPDAEIAVLFGVAAGEETTFAAHRLTPVLNDLSQTARWAAFRRARDADLPAALHIDSGMTRLGMPEAEQHCFADHPAFTPRLIISHLACADEPDHPLNRRQLKNFTAALRRLPAAPASLAASSGAFLGPEWRFDMIRPGVSLYGGAPTPTGPKPMRPVVRLQTRILQVQEVPAKRTIGYGAAYKTARPTRMATLAGGYADGYIRSLSKHSAVFSRGRELPLIGRISMDMITVDISAAPELQPGDMLDVICPERDINDLARDAGTVPHEILTGLAAARLRRVYIGEQG